MKEHEFSLRVSFDRLILILQGLMRELELREKKVNDIQAMGDRFLREGHPGKRTVEVNAVITVEV